MNKRAVKAIAGKDIKAVFSNAQMWIPMLIVPIIFVVFLPIVSIISSKASNDVFLSKNNIQYLGRIINSIPSGTLKSQVLSFSSPNQQMAYLMLSYLFAPLFLLLPVMTSSIISGGSFTGEKEKKTLESLLYSPVDERDLLFAKVLASFIPAMALTIISSLLYGVILDTVGYKLLFGKFIFPSFNWIITVFWLSPAISLLAIFLSVCISAKAKEYQEAEQYSVIIILPLMALFISQMSGVLFVGNMIAFLIGLGLFILDGVLLKYSSKLFNRQKLFLSQI